MKVTLGALTEAGARYLGFTVCPLVQRRHSESQKRDTGLRLQRLLPCCLGFGCQPLLRLLSRLRLPLRSRELPLRSRELPLRSREIPLRSRELPLRSREIPFSYVLFGYSCGLFGYSCGLFAFSPGFVKYSLGPRVFGLGLLNYSLGPRGLSRGFLNYSLGPRGLGLGLLNYSLGPRGLGLGLLNYSLGPRGLSHLQPRFEILFVGFGEAVSPTAAARRERKDQSKYQHQSNHMYLLVCQAAPCLGQITKHMIGIKVGACGCQDLGRT